MRLLRAQDYRRVPWRNGAGETAEIAVEPTGTEDFLWRVSMAPVLADGPFSRFDGVDRVLTVIEGAGLELTIAGRPPVVLGQTPLAFPGDAPCHARLTAGPIVDLNVMTRRGRWRAAVRRASRPDPLPGAGHHLAFAAGAPLSGHVGDAAFALAPRDTLWLSAAEAASLSLAGAWLDIQLFPEA